MPYKSMKEVNKALKGIDPTPTLAQCNLIAGWADSVKEKRGDVNPWAIAIALFKRKYHIEGAGDKRRWVENATSKAGPDLADQFLDLLAQMDDLDVTGVVELFPWAPPSAASVSGQPPYYGDEGEPLSGDPAYIIDLYADLPQTDEGKPDFSQPFRIMPSGPIHRFGTTRTVTTADIDQFADNWQNRETRGIRRRRIVIDVEHEPGGVGLYADIFSRGNDGLWAQIGLSERGQKVLAERDFYFFSPTVAWESQDRVTGEVIRNQIVGGALTNHPVFGDAAALPFCGYSEAALLRLWQEGTIIEGYATKTEDGVEYPASAYVIVEDPQKSTTWHLRYKEFVGGKLQITAKMVGAAASALSPGGHRGRQVKLSAAQRKKAKAFLRNLYQKTLKVSKEKIPSHLFSDEGEPMSDQSILETLAHMVGGILQKGEPIMTEPTQNQAPAAGDGAPVTEVTVEAFATLQKQVTDQNARIEALSQERDQLRTQVDQAQGQVQAEVYARQLIEMRTLAQTYDCLSMPIEVPQGAPEGTLTAQEHLAWLFSQDTDTGKPHWAFFNAVLRTANDALKDAQVFGELGAGAGDETDPDTILHQKAAAYAREHEVDYMTALKAVASS